MSPDLSPPHPEVVAIVGQTGGVGKTTTAVNLALALAAAGRTVLLIDLDPHGNAGRTLVRGHGGTGIERALLEASLTRDMIAATEIPELYLVPAGARLSGVENELALMGDSRTRLYQALASLPALPIRFDHILIDCPSPQRLLTLNALVSAHRILVPLHCDSSALDGLPSLLITIARLRAGLSHPFHGVYLLINQFSLGTMLSGKRIEPATIARMREHYGRMALSSEIPEDTAVQEASANERPLIVASPSSPATHAYLSLAAEWLTLTELDDPLDGAKRTRPRQERIAHERNIMTRRIAAWLSDPSSLLYDEREAIRHQDTPVLEALLQVTQSTPRDRPERPRSRLLIGLSLALALLVALTLIARNWLMDEQRRIDLALGLIASQSYWQAGSLLLSRADALAYREIQLATRLVGDNRERLMRCGEQARAQDAPVSCRIEVSPP